MVTVTRLTTQTHNHEAFPFEYLPEAREDRIDEPVSHAGSGYSLEVE